MCTHAEPSETAGVLYLGILFLFVFLIPLLNHWLGGHRETPATEWKTWNVQGDAAFTVWRTKLTVAHRQIKDEAGTLPPLDSAFAKSVSDMEKKARGSRFLLCLREWIIECDEPKITWVRKRRFARAVHTLCWSRGRPMRACLLLRCVRFLIVSEWMCVFCVCGEVWRLCRFGFIEDV